MNQHTSPNTLVADFYFGEKAVFTQEEQYAKDLITFAQTCNSPVEVLDKIKEFIAQGGNVNYFNPYGYQKNTLLLQVLKNHWEIRGYRSKTQEEKNSDTATIKTIVDMLLEAGANINYQNGEGHTALMCSIYQPEIFRVLLDKGANPYLIDNRGEDTLSQVLRLKIWSRIFDLTDKEEFPKNAQFEKYLSIIDQWDTGTQITALPYKNVFKSYLEQQQIQQNIAAEKQNLQEILEPQTKHSKKEILKI